MLMIFLMDTDNNRKRHNMNKQNKTALLCINDKGAATAEYLCKKDPDLRIFRNTESQNLSGIVKQLFQDFNRIVFFCATGIAVRLIAPLIRNKYEDPAVVVVDNGCRYAISLLSGHEGGANNLAFYIAGLMSAQPVITTATESGKSYTMGIGSVSGIDKDTVIKIVTTVLAEENISCDQIRIAATIPGKYTEAGIKQGLEALSINLIKIEEERISAFAPAFNKTAAARHLTIPAVAEPCALLSSHDGFIIVPVKKANGITIAVAQERICPK